jgi:hypothetical protein
VNRELELQEECMKRFQLSKLIVLLAPLLTLVLMTAQASAATSWTYTWKIVKSPNGSYHNNLLNNAFAFSEDDAWAVGANYTGGEGPPVQGLIEHWNGSHWSVVKSPDPGMNNGLQFVAGVSPDDIWISGSTMTGQFGTPSKILLEHWNGKQWSIVPSPNPGLTQNGLGGFAAVSKDDVWSVGSYDTTAGTIFHTLIMHWNGLQWSVIPSPSPGTNDLLNIVSAVSAQNIWAVGNSTINGVARTLIEHWDGSQWSIVPSPNVGTHDNVLIGVSAISQSDVWAVGFVNDSNNIMRTLIEHWNGKSWKVVPSPNVGSPTTILNNIITEVVAITATDIWTSGDYVLANGNTQTLMEHWNGSQWSVVQTPNIGSGGDYFQGIAADSANNIWAVGAYVDLANHQQLTLIEHCC